jgi:two-component system response regulator
VAGFETKHVLVVDDSLTDAELTMHALKLDGQTPLITWLSAAHEALIYIVNAGKQKGARRARPDLVLLEVDITGMGGMQLLEQLKSDSRTSDIPVVMLSARRDRQTVRRCFELGANSYLTKPDVAIEYIQKIGALARYWLILNEPAESGTARWPETRHASSMDSLIHPPPPPKGPPD